MNDGGMAEVRQLSARDRRCDRIEPLLFTLGQTDSTVSNPPTQVLEVVLPPGLWHVSQPAQQRRCAEINTRLPLPKTISRAPD